MPGEEVAAVAAEVTRAVAESAAQTAPAVAAAAEGAASAGATGVEVVAEGAASTTQEGTAAAAGQANAGLAASLEQTSSAAGAGAGINELAWGKSEPPGTTGAKVDSNQLVEPIGVSEPGRDSAGGPAGAGTAEAPTEQGAPELSREAQIASIEASLKVGEAELEALVRSGASKEDIAATEQKLGALEQQRNGLRPQAEPLPSTEADKPAGEPEPVEPASPDSALQPENPDKNLPIADRLSSAKSIRDAAEKALDSYSGTDVNELRELEQTFRKAESQYRDTQAESDRTYADQRLSSMEQRLTKAFEAQFGNLSEAMRTQRAEYEESVRNLALAIKAKTKKEEEGFLIKALAALGIAAVELFKGSGVGETIQQGTTAQRRQ